MQFHTSWHRMVRACISEKTIFELRCGLREEAGHLYLWGSRNSKGQGPGLGMFASI